MAHISLPEGLPGITGPMAFRPETAKPMNELANALLVAPNSLEQSERELIATYVSYLNECTFCHSCHGAVAAFHLNGDEDLVNAVRRDYRSAAISEKLKSLLAIAGKVQRDARSVSAEDIADARAQGATDIEIHDTVLIAAAFCMYNRYVDGLATWAPEDPTAYAAMGEQLGTRGYAAAMPA
ncbi:MAG: peroxidase-related enzyme [Candidatus Kapaibacterium sp.]